MLHYEGIEAGVEAGHTAGGHPSPPPPPFNILQSLLPVYVTVPMKESRPVWRPDTLQEATRPPPFNILQSLYVTYEGIEAGDTAGGHPSPLLLIYPPILTICYL
jgi:NAD(P)H-dependent flavin oxidoreductase YrpB (nitropropane dioxygenase family)